MRLLVFFIALMLPLSAAEVVRNGKIPTGPATTLVLREDLRLGPAMGEAFQWKGAFVAIDVNKQGDMFVTDPGSERILRFNKKGKLIMQLGGDGTFHNLAGFQVLADESGVAFENVQGPSSFSWYGTDLKRTRRKRNTDSSLLLQYARLSPDGERMGSLYFKVLEGGLDRKVATSIMDKELEVQHSISSLQLERGENNQPPKLFWAKEIGRHLRAGTKGIGIFAFAGDGALFTAVSNKYEITRWDTELKQELVFGRDYEPIFQDSRERSATLDVIRQMALAVISPTQRRFVTPDVVRKAISEAGMPKYKLPIFGLIPMEEGLLVVHDYNALTRRSVADIFSQDGHLLGSTILKGIVFTFHWANPSRLVFKNGYAYAIELNDSNQLELVRYTYALKPAA